MKRKLIFFTCPIYLLVLALGGCMDESVGFLVKGKINDQNGNIFYFGYDGKIDSTQILNDTFQFEGTVDAPTEAFVRISKNSNTPWLLQDNFMLENSRIVVNLNYSKKAKENEIREYLKIESLEGSNSQKRLDAFHEELSISFYKQENDSLKEKTLFNVLKDFLGANPKLKKGGELLAFYASKYKAYLNLEKTEILYSLLDTAYQEEKVLNKIDILINQKRHMKIGSKIPQFKLKNTSGEIFNTEQNISDFTLIDFWASWCLPCRGQNPELVKLYKLYKDKGLEIVSISLDTDLKAWNKAIKKDDMTWVNLTDSTQLVAEKYYVIGLPMTILIDKTGKIIEKDLKIFSNNDNEPSFAEILKSSIPY